MCRSFTIFFSKGGYLKYSLRQPIKWKFSSCFCTKVNGKIAIYQLDFTFIRSTHVVVVDDRDVASMEVKSLGSLNSYILIILDLLRWSNHGRTCAGSWQSWVFFWAIWLVLNGQVRIASNEMAKNVGHVFLLLKWSPGIVRLELKRLIYVQLLPWYAFLQHCGQIEL